MQFPFKATIFFILLCCLIQNNEAHATKPYIFTAVLDHDAVTIVVEKVIREAYRRLGRTIQIKYYPEKYGLALTNKGHFDGELYRGKGLEKEYPHLIPIKIPICRIAFYALSLRKNIKLESWKDLRTFSVAYMNGIRYIRDHTQGVDAHPVRSFDQAWLMLKSKRVDLVIDYTLDNNKPIFPLKMNTQFTDIKIVEPILDYIYVYHYIHKDNFLIQSQLEKTLSQMIKEGYVKKVQEEVLKNLH